MGPSYLRYMLMREQMLIAVFIVPVTLRAEPEFKIIPAVLGPAADGTFMFRYDTCFCGTAT